MLDRIGIIAVYFKNNGKGKNVRKSKGKCVDKKRVENRFLFIYVLVKKMFLSVDHDRF